MRRTRRALLTVATLAATLLVGLAPARAETAAGPFSDNTPPFDFTDAFYRQNGVNPLNILNRRTGMDGLSVIDESPDPTRRDVRVTITLPAYDHSGGMLFWNVFGEFGSNGFTRNQAGRSARAVAEASPIWVFPRADGDPLALGNNRQADMIDMRNGYFSNNPLGLWVIVFVNYTDAAFDTEEGRQALADLAERNGLDRDGTPIIKSRSELDDLTREGFVTQRRRPVDGSKGPRWSICPVIEDPTDGAIALDAFLVTVLQENGEPLPAEEDFVANFESLRLTGEWANG